MQIVGLPPAWNKDAADLLRQFLEGQVGQVFLATITANRPAFIVSNRPDAVALRAKEVEGYERCISQILRLTEPPEEPSNSAEAYPDPEDDSKWNDAKTEANNQ